MMWGGKKKAPAATKPAVPEEEDLMDFSQFTSEQNVDIQSILNDQSLHQELLDLGWEADHPATNPLQSKPKPTPHQPAHSVQLPSSASLPSEIPDLTTIGDVDEAAIALSAEDLQDPELLGMYASLGGHVGDDHEDSPPEDQPDHKQSSPMVSNKPLPVGIFTSEPVQLVNPAASYLPDKPTPPTPPTDSSTPPPSLTLEEMKARALKYKREGNNEEALRWFRLAKQREAVMASSSVAGPTNSSNSSYFNNNASSSASKPSSALPSDAGPVGKTSKPLPPVPSPAVSSVPITAPAAATAKVDDLLSPLESALQEASKSSLSLAQKHRSAHPQVAVAHMRDYKAYQQELTVLQSRRAVGGVGMTVLPPAFHWASEKTERKVERGDIGEGEIQVKIVSLEAVAGLFRGEKGDGEGKELSIVLNLNIAKEGEAAAGASGVVTTPKCKVEGGRVEFNHTVTLPILKRSRLASQLYARKKATFEIFLHKPASLLWSTPPVALAGGSIALADLVSKIEIEGPFSLQALQADEKTRVKKGQAVGGQLMGGVYIRSPLSGPLIEVIETRKLVVGPWPDVVLAPAAVANSSHAVSNNAAASAGTGNAAIPATSAGAHHPASVPVAPVAPVGPAVSAAVVPATAVPAAVVPANSAESTAPAPSAAVSSSSLVLTEKEKVDPEHIDFLVSNDVLEQEIRALEEEVTRLGGDEDAIFNSQMRLTSLRAKLSILVYRVQNDELTLEDYLAQVRERVERDKALAVFLKAQGKEGIKSAVKVLRRMKIMQEEVKNAEEAV